MKACNVCIIRPEGYLWSSVFFEMAELIAYSLEDNGLPTQITENFLSKDTVNIILGCHLADVSITKDIPPRSIFFNTEQLGEGNDLWNQRILHFVSRFESWDYSIENIQKFKNLNLRAPKHFQFGYHPKLNRIVSSQQKDIDVLFYGSLNQSRIAILDKIEKTGARITRLFGSFGKERDEYIGRSRLVLNMHQHESKIFEIIRVHYLMNNKKAVISQFDADTKIDPAYRNGLILASQNEIAETCAEFIQSENLLMRHEELALHTIMQIDANKVMHQMIINSDVFS